MPYVPDDRVSQIEQKLSNSFSPTYLLVKDQSHLHAGHAGARDGRGHYDVTISAKALDGKSRIERHRLIYAALGDMMETDIHAVRIHVRDT